MDRNNSPLILSSDQSHFWTLPEGLPYDFFDFQSEGASALLLLAVHLVDPRPWKCARQPVLCWRAPGVIDIEAKRILGKRFHVMSNCTLDREEWAHYNDGFSTSSMLTSKENLPVIQIDPIPTALDLIKSSGHSFSSWKRPTEIHKKIPGKLAPRPIFARARVGFDGGREARHYARNFSDVSSCLHAELSLLFAISAACQLITPKPEHLQYLHLESDLKPCRMCAAFLFHAQKKCHEFQVTYLQDDPGPLARHTLLDRYGYTNT